VGVFNLCVEDSTRRRQGRVEGEEREGRREPESDLDGGGRMNLKVHSEEEVSRVRCHTLGIVRVDDGATDVHQLVNE